MRFDRDRFSEIASATLTTLRKRPRLVFLGACLTVVAISFLGTQFFADRLLSSLPDKKGPLAPLPMTEQEIQEQIRTAQELNEQLRSQRAAERAYAMQRAMELGDSLGGAADGAGAIDPAPPAYAGPGAGPGGRVPRPTDFVATDEPAEPVYTAKAEYPELARESGAEGTVVVQALVGTDGRVHDTRILKSIPILNEAAESAVRRWRFRPAQSEGTPVATWVSVPVTFRR